MIGLKKDVLGGQIMKKFVWLRAKTYSYVKDNYDESKKAKDTNKCVIKIILKFRDYKKCLKASQIENIINYLEKKKIDADSLGEITKYKKVIIKTQQRHKSEKLGVFTKKINKIFLSSNDDKRIESIDLIEKYAHGMSKGFICKKEKIKRISIIIKYLI